jgi:hypothetical protein
MKLYFLLLLTGLTCIMHLSASAQCPFSPADCPESADYGSADDSASRLGNPVLPLEITMENRLRLWTGDLIERIAAREHWRYAELSEVSSSGDRSADGSVLAYPLRPPHWMMISFQLIVNEDSLGAWSNWLQTFSQRRLDATMAYAKQQVSHDAALKANDDFDKERRSQTIHFREASLLIVEFDFNMDYVKIAGVSQAAAPPHSLSGNSTIWFNNPDPEFTSIDLFERSHGNAILFAGVFNRAPDGQGYRPAWKSDKASTDHATPKKVRSDLVQSVDCHLSGNTPAIRQFLAGLAPDGLAALISRP